MHTFSSSRCFFIGLLSLMSYCVRFMTPTYPSLSGTSLPSNIDLASTPLFNNKINFLVLNFKLYYLSIISIFVKTPSVRKPFGSILRAIFRPSATVISWLAGSTARIIVFGSFIYLIAMSLVIFSMSSF